MLQTLSIRKRQIKKVVEMLSLNPSDSLPDWKFIIYDSAGRDIMDSLFSNIELRSHYITLRLPITSERDPVPDSISAIYFVTPTEENLKIICQDLESHLYESYYFNFISSLNNKRSQLAQLAEAAKSANAISDIIKIKSQYLDFISIEDDFFVLKETDKDSISYYAINRSDSTDEQITQVIELIVDGLFSVLVTLNIIPIIRCPKGGPAEVIADKLTSRLRETLQREKQSGEPKLFDRKTGNKQLKANNSRPLLCIIDRTVDMSTPLHHTWTYQAMIHDVLDIKLNKTTINEESKTQLFDLNQEDKFWHEQKGSPFPQVADAIQRELDEFKKHKDDANNKTIANIERLLKKHTTIATGLLDEIKARKLDNFFEIEEKIMNRGQIDRIIFDEMLSDSDYGTIDDKYRLFLISYICDNPCLSEEEADKYLNVLVGLGCERGAFDYIRQWKTFSKSNVVNLQASLQTGAGGVLKTASMFTKLVSQGSQFVMSGVKNLVIKEHHLPLTKIVDNLMDASSGAKSNKWSNEYRYFDPEAPTNDETLIQKRKLFQDAIVFIVGGGNYIEYQNLVDYCKSSSRNNYGTKNIIYGATDIMNASQFLNQLQQLGSLIVDQ